MAFVLFALSLYASFADASGIIRNPENPRSEYVVKGVLGEGRWGIVYRVEDSSSRELAMKVDKEPVGKGWVHREVESLREINRRGVLNRSPILVEYFGIPKSDTTENRHTIVTIAGESIMHEIRRNRLADYTAASIGF